MRDFKKLKIWQVGMDIVEDIYFLTSGLPEEEKFGLTSQMRRSARSIPSNIAEGSSRRSKVDYARFLEVSEGSAFELETDLRIIIRLKLANTEKARKILDILDQEQRMIMGLINSLRKS